MVRRCRLDDDEYARPSHKVVTAAGVVAVMVACLTIIWLWPNGPDSASVALAVANSQFPDAVVVDNMVVHPAVPISVGARAAGEADLLTLDDDEAARTLNRRTEFIFGGLLIE